MAAIKALLIAGLVTVGIFLIIVWIIPIVTFLIIFTIIALIAYVIIKEDRRDTKPP